MKEPEAPAPTCPDCGARGARVERATLAAEIGDEGAGEFTSDAYCCWTPGCSVGYFDAWGNSVPAASLTSPAYPKFPEAPVCPCLAESAEVVIAEAREGRRDAVLRIIEHARGPEAACAARSPDGQPCTQRVRRLFLDHGGGR